jgi:hypothetical protein
MEELKQYYYEYFKNKIEISETYENNKKSDNNSYYTYELIEDPAKKLGESFEAIQNLMFILRNNFSKILKLIEIVEDSSIERKENVDTLVDLLCHQFYENLLIQNPENEELLILCTNLLIKEIENMNSASVSSFIDEGSSFVGKLLKAYTKRQDLKTYLTMALGDIITNIDNHTENPLDLDITRIGEHIRDKKAKEILNKSYNYEKSKTLLYGIDNENLTRRISKSKIFRVF